MLPSIDFDRRDNERLSRVFPVFFQGCEAHALDVSRTGLRILSPQPLHEEDSVELTLEVEPDLKLQLMGRPVWQQPLNRAGHHMVGLHFVYAGSDDLERWLEAQCS